MTFGLFAVIDRNIWMSIVVFISKRVDIPFSLIGSRSFDPHCWSLGILLAAAWYTHTHRDIQTHHACHPYRVSRTFVCDNVNISVIFFHLSAVNNECNKLLLTDSYLYYTGSSLLHTGLLLITLFLNTLFLKSLNTYVMMHPAEPDKQL